MFSNSLIHSINKCLMRSYVQGSELKTRVPSALTMLWPSERPRRELNYHTDTCMAAIHMISAVKEKSTKLGQGLWWGEIFKVKGTLAGTNILSAPGQVFWFPRWTVWPLSLLCIQTMLQSLPLSGSCPVLPKQTTLWHPSCAQRFSLPVSLG